MKIVILDGHAVNPGDLSWDILKPFGDLTVYEYTAPEQTIPRLQGADIALTNKTILDAKVLDACPDLKLICVLATGYNVVDCADTRRRGIPVCNVPAYGTAAVAQFTFALLLELCHKVSHHNKAVHDGRWCSSRDFCFWETPQMELAGKTMGIIGFGRIGRAVGTIAKAMGMEVIAYNRSRCAEGEAIGTYVDLETLLKTSDIISLHCPLTDENAGLINENTLSMMKDGAILLNTARGPLLDEKAVADALRSGKLRGAAVDVVSKEPMEYTNPLLTAPNCIITPHMAWAPTESRRRIQEITARSIAAFLEGKPINTVNM